MSGYFSCPICFDLDYGQFGAREDGIGNNAIPRHPLTRYRLVTRARVEAAAQNLCPFCAVLYEGMAIFWNDLDSFDDTDDSSSQSNDAEEHPSHNDHNVQIELRPGRSLSVVYYPIDTPPYRTEIHPILEFFVDKNDSRPIFHPAFGKGGIGLSRLDSDSAAKLVGEWLKACNQHHDCSPDFRQLPRRLIDISTARPRLLETGNMELVNARYMTLSHCWGGPNDARPMTTTKDTYDTRRQGIALKDFPCLFQDVITIVRMLGCRYLWIDSLCIIQDDNGDWLEQSANMATIYSNSYLNLASACARNSSETLFTDRFQSVEHELVRAHGSHSRKVMTHVIRSGNTSSAKILVRPGNSWAHQLVIGDALRGRCIECPLLDRGWVYQEQLLAPRTVFFARSELMWRCKESIKCECMDMDNLSDLAQQVKRQSLDSQHTLQNARLKDLMIQDGSFLYSEKNMFEEALSSISVITLAQDFWLHVVERYSTMSLSQESDRPHAVAGIARRLQSKTGDTYLAGLWLHDLPRTLLWSVRPWSHPENRRLNCGIPSWSWMSVKCPSSPLRASYSFERGFQQHAQVKVIKEETWCRTDDHDEYGPALSGQITIEAASLHATVAIRRGQFYVSFGNEQSVFISLVIADCPYDNSELLRDGEEVFLLLLGLAEMEPDTNYCLVVRSARDSREVYRRVGIVEAHITKIIAREAQLLRWLLR